MNANQPVVFVRRGQAGRDPLAHLNDIRSGGVSNHRTDAHGFLGREGEIAVVGSYSVDRIYEAISSACNHSPDVSPSKPERPQVFNEPHPKTGRALSEFLHAEP